MINIRYTKKETIAALVARKAGESQDVSATVAEILANVRQNGDTALQEYTQKFDQAAIVDFKVSQAEIDAALSEVSAEFLAILQQAKQNITAFHEKQVQQGFVMTEEQGIVMGQRVLPLE